MYTCFNSLTGSQTMFAWGRHFRDRTFASNYSSTQDTDLELCYNIKIISQKLASSVETKSGKHWLWIL